MAQDDFINYDNADPSYYETPEETASVNSEDVAPFSTRSNEAKNTLDAEEGNAPLEQAPVITPTELASRDTVIEEASTEVADSTHYVDTKGEPIKMSIDEQMGIIMTETENGYSLEEINEFHGFEQHPLATAFEYATANGLDKDDVAAKFGIDMDELDTKTSKLGRSANQAVVAVAQTLNGLADWSMGGSDTMAQTTADLETYAQDIRDIYKSYNSELDNEGNVDKPWDVSGSVAEAGLYMAPGLFLGRLASAGALTTKAALAADALLATTVDLARYSGSEVEGEAGFSGTDAMIGVAANIAGFGLGRYLLKGTKSPKDLPEPMTKESMSAYEASSAEAKAFTLEMVNWAEKNNVKLRNMDIDKRDTTMQMFIAEASKNFTTASAVQKEVEGNLDALVKATYNEIAIVKDATNQVPVAGRNVQTELNNAELRMSDEINAAYDNLKGLDAGNARINATLLVDHFKESSTYKNVYEGEKKALESKFKEVLANADAYTPSELYKVIKNVASEAADAYKSDATKGRAYDQFNKYLEQQMDKLAKLSGNEGFLDELAKAKALYKEKSAVFGYGDSGKGAQHSAIPKIRDAENPEDVVKLLKDPNAVAQVDKYMSPKSKEDLGDVILSDIVARNPLKGQTGDAYRLDFSAIGKEINSIDTRTLDTLYGKERAADIKGYATLAEVMGKYTKGSDVNVLGAIGEKKLAAQAAERGMLSTVKHFTGVAFARWTSKALIKADKTKAAFAVKQMEKELAEAGIDNPREFLKSVAPDIDKVANYKKAPKKNEDYTLAPTSKEGTDGFSHSEGTKQTLIKSKQTRDKATTALDSARLSDTKKSQAIEANAAKVSDLSSEADQVEKQAVDFTKAYNKLRKTPNKTLPEKAEMDSLKLKADKANVKAGKLRAKSEDLNTRVKGNLNTEKELTTRKLAQAEVAHREATKSYEREVARSTPIEETSPLGTREAVGDPVFGYNETPGAAKAAEKKTTEKSFVSGGLSTTKKQSPKKPTKKQELDVLVKKRSTSGQALDEVLPTELKGNIHAIDVLEEAQDVSAKDKQYAQIMVTKGHLEGTDNYIKPTYAPNPHYSKSLSKASVKRIREGKGTEADFEALKADIGAREHEVGGDGTNPFLSGGL
jgi:hypothetical protein